ncbi:MAG TPA: hypothetical protein VGE85_11500 [Terracidiphilus sp.]
MSREGEIKQGESILEYKTLPELAAALAKYLPAGPAGPVGPVGPAGAPGPVGPVGPAAPAAPKPAA